MMRAVARTGTHVRSGHFPTSPTLNPSSQAVALVRNNIPTSAFSSTRAFSDKLQALVRNNIPTRAYSYSAFSQNDTINNFMVPNPKKPSSKRTLPHIPDTNACLVQL